MSSLWGSSFEREGLLRQLPSNGPSSWQSRCPSCLGAPNAGLRGPRSLSPGDTGSLPEGVPSSAAGRSFSTVSVQWTT